MKRLDHVTVEWTKIEKEWTNKDNVYESTVEASNRDVNLYIGATENFKPRHSDHLQDFKNKSKQNRTKLALHIWTLKDYKIPYNIKWEVQAKASAYNSGSRNCDLCLTEKLHILEAHKNLPTMILNKRSEIANKCRHHAKFKLQKVH